MAKRISVVVSQGQSNSPAKRDLEEELVTALMTQPGVDVTVIPNLYDLKPDGTGMLALQGIGGNMIVFTWLFERGAFWTLDRQGILGQEGVTLLKYKEADDEDDEDSQEGDKVRVRDNREVPPRTIHCIDLRAASTAAEFVEEVKRIAAEHATQVVGLTDWLGGSGTPEQMSRFLNPTNDTSLGGNGASGNGNGKSGNGASGNGNGDTIGRAKADAPTADLERADSLTGEPRRVEEQAGRRWYPVIDFSRCTNCMECIDFCLFGVYGVDAAETILVEQPDSCRKGCPACSRVCPENAIIFPQHKTPMIAGAPGAGAGGLKIDLSQLFGAPDAVEVAARERDEQLLLAGRDVVGLNVGMPKRQDSRADEPKDDLDDLIDSLDDMDL